MGCAMGRTKMIFVPRRLYVLGPANLSVYPNIVEHASFVNTRFASAVSDF
jgi:hypothetical protein